jgi:diacylglycerol O-acyltransferase / wax synthase
MCAELNEVPLDRSRPLWEIWLLIGMAGNRLGLLIRLHHVVADGMAVLALLAPLFELADTGSPAPPPEEDNKSEPDPFGRRVLSAFRHGGQLVALQPARGKQLAILLQQARSLRLSVNRPVGPGRRLTLLRADLAATKAVAHAHDGKVNDVVLAAVAGGTRRLLESRGELRSDLSINVSLATSIRRGEDPRSTGNRVGIRVVRIPVGEPNPIRRLKQIVAATTAQRPLPPYQPSGRLLQRWMVRVMNHQRLVNLIVSNLPGPPVRLTFAGCPVLEMFQVGLVQGNLAIGVGVLSYAGQLTSMSSRMPTSSRTFTSSPRAWLRRCGIWPRSGHRPRRPRREDVCRTARGIGVVSAAAISTRECPRVPLLSPCRGPPG